MEKEHLFISIFTHPKTKTGSCGKTYPGNKTKDWSLAIGKETAWKAEELIRRYFPKGTDFRTITQEEIDDIIEEINGRPRKCLNYNTPKEVFNAYLKGENVAIQLRM